MTPPPAPALAPATATAPAPAPATATAPTPAQATGSALPQPVDTHTLRRIAIGIQISDLLPWNHWINQQDTLLHQHLTTLIPAVEEAARLRPIDSLLREVALDHVAATRTLMNTGPHEPPAAAVRHVKHLARQLQDLCDHHDMLTGAKLLGTT